MKLFASHISYHIFYRIHNFTLLSCKLRYLIASSLLVEACIAAFLACVKRTKSTPYFCEFTRRFWALQETIGFLNNHWIDIVADFNLLEPRGFILVVFEYLTYPLSQSYIIIWSSSDEVMSPRPSQLKWMELTFPPSFSLKDFATQKVFKTFSSRRIMLFTQYLLNKITIFWFISMCNLLLHHSDNDTADLYKSTGKKILLAISNHIRVIFFRISSYEYLWLGF